MHDLTLRDNQFDFNSAERYQLSIQISLDGFSFCISQPELKRIHVLVSKQLPGSIKTEQLAGEFAAFISENELLKGNYALIQLFYTGTTYQLVPDVFVKDKHTADLLHFQTKITESKTAFSKKVYGTDFHLSFALPSALVAEASKLGQNVQYYSHIHPFLTNILLYQKGPLNEHKAFVYFHKGYFDLAISKHDRLLFCNTFAYQSPNDAAYFIVGAYQSLELDPHLVTLIVSGEMSASSDIFWALHAQFSNIRFEKPSADISFAFEFDRAHSHYLTTLIHSVHCG